MADKDKPKATTRLPRINRRGATAENIADMPESVRDSIRRQLQEQKVTVAAPIKRVLGLVRDNTDDRRKMRVEQAARSEEIQTQTTATNSRLSTVVEEQKKTTGLLRELLNTIRQNRGLGGRGSGGGRNDPRRTSSLPSRIWNFTRNVALPAVGLGAIYFAGQERMQREGLVPTPNRPLNLLTNNALSDFDPIGMNDREDKDINREPEKPNTGGISGDFYRSEFAANNTENVRQEAQTASQQRLAERAEAERAMLARVPDPRTIEQYDREEQRLASARARDQSDASIGRATQYNPRPTPAPISVIEQSMYGDRASAASMSPASAATRYLTPSPTTNQQPQTTRPPGILRRLFLDPIRPSSDSGGFDLSAVRNAAFRIDESRDEAAPRAMGPELRNIVFKAQEIKFKADEFEFVRPEVPSGDGGGGGGMSPPGGGGGGMTPPSGGGQRGSGDESSLQGGYGAPLGGTSDFGLPMDNIRAGSVSSGFGPRPQPPGGGSTNHQGVDIPVPIGTPVYATHDGIVSIAGELSGYGLVVYLNGANGIQTRYGHLSRIEVRVNERVERGRIIGYSGNTTTANRPMSTGPHLHYEIRRNGTAIPPESVNPELARIANPQRNNQQQRQTSQQDATPVAPSSSQGRGESGDMGTPSAPPPVQSPPAAIPVDRGINMKVGEELNAASMNSQVPIPIAATMGGDTATPVAPYNDSTVMQTRSIDPDNPGNVEPADAMTYYAELFPGLRLAA